ncbi:MAG TPA: pilus assembly PilX N-terminal domain-containing protein [Methylomirabilota bacterium]|nr:pilus assembly PilX N-terminal domain-containing protein [Methylomirabilota bacterium]
MALPLAMILLMILTMLTIAFMSLGAVEPQISANLSDGARARQLAESGIEWAMSTQIGNVDFNSSALLGGTMTSGGQCGTGNTCRVLASSQTMPGLTSTQGTFGVTLRNDINTNTGDQALIGTGNTRDPSATADVNGFVILSSTGAFNGASRTITAVLQRGNLNINAAVSLPGVQTDTFSNDPPCSGCYSIDGHDWKIADTSSPTGANPTKLGIATYTGTETLTGLSYEANAEAGFNDTQKRGYVQGADVNDGSGDAAGTGRRTIAADTSLNPTIIQNFLTNLASNPATQIINSTQACQYASGSSTKPEGLRMVSTSTANHVTVTNNCTGADQINQTVNLGSATSPALVYIKGEYDPSSNFIGLAVSGSQAISGYGVLVMEEADLSFFQSGQFTWNGIVIVTGRNVGVGFRGGSNTEIRGALIANETDSGEVGGYFEFLNQAATMKIRYGKEGIDLALRALYNTRILSYREN